MEKSKLQSLIRKEIFLALNELHSEQKNYMFFQNLHTIQHMVEKMLKMDMKQVDELLSNHAWAVDHISTSTDDITEVGQWLCNNIQSEVPTNLTKIQ